MLKFHFSIYNVSLYVYWVIKSKLINKKNIENVIFICHNVHHEDLGGWDSIPRLLGESHVH